MVRSPNDIEVMRDLRGFLTDEQRSLILGACSNDRDRLLITLLWKSGRRISEILMLKRDHIDENEATIFYPILKKKRFRVVPKPVDKKTYILILKFIMNEKIKKGEYVFKGRWTNTHLSRQRAFQIVRKLCDEVGIKFVGEKKPHPHHFRHSRAIDLSKRIKSGADLRKLQMFMEHSNLAMTEKYLQFADEDLRSLIED